MELIVNWMLRAVLLALGGASAVWIARWFHANWSATEERWTIRLAAGMIVLAGGYTLAHGRLLVQRGSIEEGRERYAAYGDPRRTEQRRAEVRGWLLDCTGEPERALASYRQRGETIEREYPLGAGGANFIGGGEEAEERDYTIEMLFASRLREPRGFGELGTLHPAGRDLQLTLCQDVTAEAWRQISQTGLRAAVIVQDASTGAVLGYAATGGPDDAPFGIKQYSPPGSVFKLALAALWWERGLPDDVEIPCPAEIRVTPRATIANFGRIGYGSVAGPTGMLVPSCNTAAVWMAARMREEIGEEAFLDAYGRFGFLPYADVPPMDTIGEFWRTTSSAWTRRMTPAPSRLRLSRETGPAEWAQLAIGQGPVDVTVAGVSRFIQAIANGGVMLPPTLEAELAADTPRGERVMSEATARRLQAAMRAVVERGTGRAAVGVLQGTGWSMGGKTGTAQVAGRADNGWFAGILFSPEGEARFTVVALVEGGGGGGGRPTVIASNVARVLAERPARREGD